MAFSALSFYIVQEVIASLQKNASIIKETDPNINFWFKQFSEKNLPKEHSKLVLVNFWASWCQPCQKELPSLVALRKRFNESEMYIIGINCDDDKPEKKVREIEQKHALNFPNITDIENKNLRLIGAETLPVTMMFYDEKLIFSSYQGMDFAEDSFLKIIDDAHKKNQTN